jgi:chromosome segregation ATPase
MDELSDNVGKVKQTSGSNFLSCEPELIELMRQIDIMVEEKRNEWEQQVQSSDAQLKRMVEEYNLLREKSIAYEQTIGQLQQSLAGSQLEKNQLAENHKLVIKNLKQELNELKKKYNRLQKKTANHQNQKDAESNQIHFELESRKLEVKSLQEKAKVSELREIGLTKEVQILKEQLSNSDGENKKLMEKSDELQGQLSSFQSQLNRRREMLEDIERESTRKVALAETNSEKYRDKISQQEISINKLKKQLMNRNERSKTEDEKTEQFGKELENIRKENITLKELLRAKDENLQIQESKIKKKILENATLTKDLEDSNEQHKINQSSIQISPYRQENEPLKMQVNVLADQLDDKEAQLQISRLEISNLKIENRKLKDNILNEEEAEKSRAEALISQNAEKCSSQEKRLLEAEQENQKLMSQIKRLQTERLSRDNTQTLTETLNRSREMTMADERTRSALTDPLYERIKLLENQLVQHELSKSIVAPKSFVEDANANSVDKDADTFISMSSFSSSDVCLQLPSTGKTDATCEQESLLDSPNGTFIGAFIAGSQEREKVLLEEFASEEAQRDIELQKRIRKRVEDFKRNTDQAMRDAGLCTSNDM